MYELIQVGKNTFYMDCPAKVGFYRTAENEVVLIDSGSDKDCAKKVKKILDSQNWNVKAIFNTHSHADHIGGNAFLQEKYNCKIYATETEKAVCRNTVFEPTSLYGGFVMDEMRNKFLMAKPSTVDTISDEVLPKGMEIISLPGHSYDMIGFRTADNTVFLADALMSEATVQKYAVGFLYDVEGYLDTLEMIKDMKADCFVPSHASACDNIASLAQLNIDVTNDIINFILKALSEPHSFEELLSKVFDNYNLNMNLQQRMLVGHTVKSYLSYLKNKNEAEYIFEDNVMLWKAV